jgi:hypothetical protein
MDGVIAIGDGLFFFVLDLDANVVFFSLVFGFWFLVFGFLRIGKGLFGISIMRCASRWRFGFFCFSACFCFYDTLRVRQSPKFLSKTNTCVSFISVSQW